ncbi:MAG: thioredoxin family protein [bacterium]
MEKIQNWKEVSAQLRQENIPVVILIDQEDCPYCRRVEGEFIAGLVASRELEGQAVFGKISIDPGETIVNQDGDTISTRDFLAGLNTSFTPTILFLDGDKNELAEKMIGLSTPDYYGYYLEQSIKSAINILRS